MGHCGLGALLLYTMWLAKDLCSASAPSLSDDLSPRHPRYCTPRLNAFSLLGPCCPSSPFSSNSSVDLAVSTPRCHNLTLHRLLAQRKPFKLLPRTILVSLSVGFVNISISLVSFDSFLNRISFSLVALELFPSRLREQLSLIGSLVTTGANLARSVLVYRKHCRSFLQCLDEHYD